MYITHNINFIQVLKKEWRGFKNEHEIYFSSYTAQPTPSVGATVQVSHALPAVGLSCLLRGHMASFQDGVAAGKRFLCAPF
jgi:hypothetical protein